MGFFFYFKRVVGMVMQPLPVAFFFLALGLALVLFTRRKRNAAASLILGMAVLFVASFPPLVRWQAGLLEGRYPPLRVLPGDGDPPVAVVVLGNGVAHPDDASLPALSRLNHTARARLVEGVRVWRMIPDAVLITTGYGMGLENCGDAMALAALELGVAAERIRRLSGSLDTEHEIRLMAAMAEGGGVVVVTSAAHMPRTMAHCARLGLRAVPAPCDYIAPVSGEGKSAVNRYRWRPRGGSLADSEALWHEVLGLLHDWMRKAG